MSLKIILKFIPKLFIPVVLNLFCSVVDPCNLIKDALYFTFVIFMIPLDPFHGPPVNLCFIVFNLLYTFPHCCWWRQCEVDICRPCWTSSPSPSAETRANGPDPCVRIEQPREVVDHFGNFRATSLQNIFSEFLECSIDLWLLRSGPDWKRAAIKFCNLSSKKI